MARNKLSDLNDHLFAQLERLSDEEMNGEELDKEISRSKAVSQVSSQIINNAKVTLEAARLVDGGDIRKERVKGLYQEETKKLEK